MEKYQLLFESVFKKDPADPDVPGFLKKIAEEYPYFSTAQFYLLQSLKKDSAAYKKQVKKTAVIFNNNYWLNFQLLEAAKPHHSIVDQQMFSLEEETNSMPTPNGSPEDEDLTATTVENAPGEIAPVETPLQTPEEVIPAQENIVEIEAEQPAPDQPYPDEVIIPTTSEPEVIAPNNKPEPEQEPPVMDSEVKDTEVEAAVEATVVEVPEEKETLPPITLPNHVATGNAEKELLFEPLHTTDYFASVGIKLSEEAKSADKLGKQLKSFTEWLKTMKKVHAEQLTRASSPAEIEADNTESNIQQLAERSNVEDEVLTEAMADVLLQQGRTNKALEVLEKLSLLNPAKSAYFAAKINQIKAS